MSSRNLQVVDGQGELPFARRNDAPVADSVIHSQRDFLAALNLQINVSGLDDKELYMALGIDAAHWSRIRKGDAHFPLNALNRLCDLTQNEIALEWWAHARGKGLHLLLSEAERRLAAERIKAEKLEAENKLLRDLVQGKAR